jgi:cytochrome c oxidase assembly protein subunit 15
LVWRLGGLLLLGGLQGFIGWYMVQSGLVQRVDVSQYRLALHLTLAAMIFTLTIWLALGIGQDRGPSIASPVWRASASGLAALVLLHVASGAFVAGLDAGLSHNTWPLMDGALVPAGLLAMSPWTANLFENVLTVQFDHRLLAYGIAVWAGLQAIAALRRNTPWRTTALLLAGAVVVQIGLGVWTLLAHVPIGLGLLHQAGAFLVLATAVWHLKRVVG